MKIKAIPTTYGGQAFRSKLEARWALNLDRWRIAWTYEPEGYQLPSGDWYLPDFWLPDINTWLEVKGPGVPGLGKFEEFARVQGSEDWVQSSMAFVVGGLPLRVNGADIPSWRQACRYCGDWLPHELPYGSPRSFLAECSTRTCIGRAQFVSECANGCGMDSRCFVCSDKVYPLVAGPFAKLPAPVRRSTSSGSMP